MIRRLLFLMVFAVGLSLLGCGGGGGNEGSTTGNKGNIISVAAPTNAKVTSSTSKNTITWDGVAGATSYNIYWSTSPSFSKSTGNKIINASTPYIHSGLADGTKYFYAVTSVKDNIESDMSSSIDITASKVVAVDVQGDSVIALKSDGSVWTWGHLNDYNNGSTALDSTSPKQVTQLSSVTKVATGLSHFLALKSDGTVWAWGDNKFGQLGDGTTTRTPNPVRVDVADVVDIAAGELFSLAIKRDGTVWAWGWNGSVGNLGYGVSAVNDFKSTPVQVLNLTNVIAVKASTHAVAIKSDGTLWAWGYNAMGQLGDGTNVDKSAPVMVNGIADVVYVSVKPNATYAVKSDGTLWSWGYDVFQILGAPSTHSSRLTPGVVSGISEVKTVSTFNTLGLVLTKNDMTVWTVEVDDSANMNLIRVDSYDDGVMTVSSRNVNVILESDGSLSGWGLNNYQALGVTGSVLSVNARTINGI